MYFVLQMSSHVGCVVGFVTAIYCFAERSSYGKGRKEYMIDLYCSINAAVICSSKGNREPKILSLNLFQV